ncbi:MAG: hypothetical protein ABUJ98_12560 [Hyphomicrobium sp.]|jgi:uncharacterized membrane protein
MNYVLETPFRSLLTGFGIAGLALTAWLVTGPVDPIELTSVLLRFVHVVSAMAWIGLVFFVNFVQLKALEEADEASRNAISKWIVPRVAAGFRHASHLTVISGGMLLILTGYLLVEWVNSSAAYLPLPRILMLVAGALGGLVMWVLVNFVIGPSLKIALTGDAAGKARARQTVKRYARLNLVLALPVAFAMVAAAHLV